MKTSARMPLPDITVICTKPAWRRRMPALVANARKAAFAAYKAAGWDGKKLKGQFSICFGDDREVHRLNKAYRGKDKPTNVLSFANCDQGGIEKNYLPDGKSCALGDIILAYETVRDEALAQNKPFAYHGLHLVVHGVLHLLGYDHMTARQAARMETLEKTVLRRLGIPNPYRVRGRWND